MKATLFGLAILLVAQGAPAQVGSPAQPTPSMTAIEQAAAARKFAFVFFWRDKNPQTDSAWAALEPAVAKLGDTAVVAAVHITDPAEKELVTRYDVSRAPMPLVLAVAPCGAITKAFTGNVDEAQLRTALVSPCTQLCMKGLQDRKLVMLCVLERKGPQEPLAAPPGVQEFKADPRVGPATEVVLLNAADQAEASFLQGLQVTTQTPKPLTVFMAPPGTVIGKFPVNATKDQLLAQLVAAQSNPCAGGKCGPGGCGPKR